MAAEYMLLATNKSLKWITTKQVFQCKANYNLSSRVKLPGDAILAKEDK